MSEEILKSLVEEISRFMDWVRENVDYRFKSLGETVKGLEGRVLALEAVQAGLRLKALEGSVKVLEERFRTLEEAVRPKPEQPILEVLQRAGASPDQFTVEWVEEEGAWHVAPTSFLGRELFSAVSRSLRNLGGEWVSAKRWKDSYWRVPKVE